MNAGTASIDRADVTVMLTRAQCDAAGIALEDALARTLSANPTWEPTWLDANTVRVFTTKEANDG